MRWLLIALGVLIATPASAQTTPIAACLPHDQMAAALKQRHGEVLVGYGLRPQYQIIVELYVSPLGTWTIVSRWADGKTCVRSFGEGWIRLRPEVGEPS